MWTANGMFGSDENDVRLYCPDGIKEMWGAIAKAWPEL
jgi:hypothetical protein